MAIGYETENKLSRFGNDAVSFKGYTSFMTTTTPAQISAADQPFTETAEQHAARMEWWREARFGLFIHFGLYGRAQILSAIF